MLATPRVGRLASSFSIAVVQPLLFPLTEPRLGPSPADAWLY